MLLTCTPHLHVAAHVSLCLIDVLFHHPFVVCSLDEFNRSDKKMRNVLYFITPLNANLVLLFKCPVTVL